MFTQSRASQSQKLPRCRGPGSLAPWTERAEEARTRHGRAEPVVKKVFPERFAGREAVRGSGSCRVGGERHPVARPGSAEKMPGATQPRWSSDDDEGVEVALVGGDREGRVNASPRGLEGARSERSPRRGDFTSTAAPETES
jgi:hypothetical protein